MVGGRGDKLCVGGRDGGGFGGVFADARGAGGLSEEMVLDAVLRPADEAAGSTGGGCDDDCALEIIFGGMELDCPDPGELSGAGNGG
mmetsp:Transcript_8276/g.21748  ORF Transcript_8276/g.21748 Transcript_8276/m.21748 type:complete len:87 (-) Transcript_8276:167-427(-)